MESVIKRGSEGQAAKDEQETSHEGSLIADLGTGKRCKRISSARGWPRVHHSPWLLRTTYMNNICLYIYIHIYRDNIVRDQILQYPREAGWFWLYGIDITPENVKIHFLCIDISVLAFTSVAPPPTVSQFAHVSFPPFPPRQRSITNAASINFRGNPTPPRSL